MPYEQYLPFLEKVLTPRRLAHSLGVMGVMGELADVYGFDREKALVTGVLHDAGKDLTAAQQAEILSQAGIEIRYECESDYVHYLHGPVGAYFVRRELGLTDPLILDAIRMHTYYGNGAAFDLPICWCLRFSDLLEPTRDWSGVRWLRNGIARLRDAAYGGSHARSGLSPNRLVDPVVRPRRGTYPSQHDTRVSRPIEWAKSGRFFSRGRAVNVWTPLEWRP